MTKFQKFRVPECLLYKCTLLIMTLPKRSNITVTLKFFFYNAITLNHLCLAINTETSHIFLECFLMIKIMLLYAKILLTAKMSIFPPKHEFENIVTCCNSILEIFLVHVNKIGADVPTVTPYSKTNKFTFLHYFRIFFLRFHIT